MLVLNQPQHNSFVNTAGRSVRCLDWVCLLCVCTVMGLSAAARHISSHQWPRSCQPAAETFLLCAYLAALSTSERRPAWEYTVHHSRQMVWLSVGVPVPCCVAILQTCIARRSLPPLVHFISPWRIAMVGKCLSHKLASSSSRTAMNPAVVHRTQLLLCTHVSCRWACWWCRRYLPAQGHFFLCSAACRWPAWSSVSSGCGAGFDARLVTSMETDRGGQ